MYHRNNDGKIVFSGPVSPAEIFKCAEALAMEAIYARAEVISAPQDVARAFKHRLLQVQHEEFHVMFLDARHRVITVESMFRGNLTGAAVYIGEVVRAALLKRSAALIIAHNHPSGDCNPSSADRELTERLRQALALVDVRLLDHIVVAGDTSTSFAERGWL